MTEAINPELESFRKQWQEEVTARSKGAPTQSDRPARPLGPPKKPNGATESIPLSRHNDDADEDVAAGGGYHDLVDKDEARRLGEEGEGIHPSDHANREPKSALEHYEKAVERELQGNLGDSLKLYRKAYRLDSGVDRIYKNKYFPPSFNSKPGNPNPSNAPVTVPNPAHHSLGGPPPCPIPDLIASFSSLSIPATTPPTDQFPPPPCPLSTLPSELLIDILYHTAVADVASFARLALVCKHLAYLVATEDRIWKRVCLGPEHGFGAMHYKWNCTVSGEPLSHPDDIPLDDETNPENPCKSNPASKFPLTPLYPTYKTMFHLRPRIRFGGCYISTVNYIRPGASSASQVSWNTPVHIVTYYRYLRFFRDGSCISLLTTAEPADVVHHLSKPNLHTHHAGGLPSAIMNHALRGRWRLSGPSSPSPFPSPSPSSSASPTTTTATTEKAEAEGTLHIETLGVDADKYTYALRLALRRASSGRRSTPAAGAAANTKLAWRGFWSYNKLTDDWAEFGLRNDRAFVWSRVGSYAREEEGLECGGGIYLI